MAARKKWSELPKIEGELRTAVSTVSVEAEEWARDLLERNRVALRELDVAAGRHQGDCPNCRREGVLLYLAEPNDPGSTLICSRCVGRAANRDDRQQLCDNDPEHGPAWRNPYTRRNEYLCANCHGNSGDGVIQNKWATTPRFSKPLGVREGAVCAAANVPGTKPCRGEIKPRGAAGTLLCNQHAGKSSAADEYFER